MPWRIQQVIEKVRARAVEKGLPPELAEALWRQMIGWFIQYEEEKLAGITTRPKILVMPDLVPGIHAVKLETKTWMAGTSPATTSLE